ncbi:hypothetical protein BC939DRAFT_451768 [Gamsiella multidivaricata]|uniref:uncharacterized protein n=1 Tax=Gamsiella multidivaricata TaxID=101098 RepID=UPI00221E65FD|nr:uncharacterized protein BC939DRAFT_451768 [Gamsiella multidivaricata]KAI7823349.1 hypothetical protein BC939DRAFT_451768 [Gamsiella multidivaricata]
MHTHLTCPSSVTIRYRLPRARPSSWTFRYDSSCRRSAPSRTSSLSTLVCSSAASTPLLLFCCWSSMKLIVLSTNGPRFSFTNLSRPSTASTPSAILKCASDGTTTPAIVIPYLIICISVRT